MLTPAALDRMNGLGDSLRDRANALAAKAIAEETKFLLDQQAKQAEADLRREAAKMAVDMAEKMVRGAFNAGDQQRMVESFVGDVAAPVAPTSGGRQSGGPA